MKIGMTMSQFKWDGDNAKIGENLRAVAQKAEEVGFDSEWVMDHFFQIQHVGAATDPMLEAYTTLGYVAAVTERVTLGTMVTGVIYRAPGLLIKAVTTLDVLSRGRAYFGIGAGWNEEEAIGLGLTPPLKSGRFERLEETLNIAKQMWAGDESPIHGEYYQLERPLSSPQPVQKPHPPILIGGGGEQKTLRMVAKYADACNLFAKAPDLEHKLEVLKQHCQEVRTDYDRIEKTAMFGMPISKAADDADAVIKRAEELSKMGISHLIFSNDQELNLKAFDQFGKDLVTRLHAM